MQYRLSTLFLLTAVVASSLAAFGAWGFISLGIIFIVAFCFHFSTNPTLGLVGGNLLFIVLHGCSGILIILNDFGDSWRKSQCEIGLRYYLGPALSYYHDANKHFPPTVVRNANGEALRSWRAEVLQYLYSYGNFFSSLYLDEPWDSKQNASRTKTTDIDAYVCYLNPLPKKTGLTCVVAVVGSGMAWRADRPVTLSELPDGGSHTVSVVEIASEEVYWAEPRDLTVEEALEGLKTGKGLRISSYHPYSINVLFANGNVFSFPSRMPLEFWEKLLAGEIKNPALYARGEQYTPYIPEKPSPEVEVSLNPERFVSEWERQVTVGIWFVLSIWFLVRAAKSNPYRKNVPPSAIDNPPSTYNEPPTTND